MPQSSRLDSIIAMDVDYTGQTGFVGSPVSGAYVRQALTDVDYIRRVTYNVAYCVASQLDRIELAGPLPGGIPIGWCKVTAGYWICGSRGREFLSRVVRAVCHGRQPG